jgi:hypothetical protein
MLSENVYSLTFGVYRDRRGCDPIELHIHRNTPGRAMNLGVSAICLSFAVLLKTRK